MEDWWGERHFYLIATSQNPTEYMRQYLIKHALRCVYIIYNQKNKKRGYWQSISMCVRAHL